MKFVDDNDRRVCLAELKSEGLVSDGESLDEALTKFEVQNYFVRRRRVFVRRLKDFRRSQLQKMQWRRGRYKFLRGIRRFARSVLGKRFYRSLSRFLQTRGVSRFRVKLFEGDQDYLISPPICVEPCDMTDFCVWLSSCRTHLLLETHYYMQVSEEADYLMMLELVLPHLNELLNKAESALCDGSSLTLSEDDVYFLDSLVGFTSNDLDS